MHLGVSGFAFVLGGAGGRNKCGVDCRTGLEKEALDSVRGSVDSSQDLIGQLVFFQPVAKAQDGALVGQPSVRLEMGKLAWPGLTGCTIAA